MQYLRSSFRAIMVTFFLLGQSAENIYVFLAILWEWYNILISEERNTVVYDEH